jgi:hypothetical protein
MGSLLVVRPSQPCGHPAPQSATRRGRLEESSGRCPRDHRIKAAWGLNPSEGRIDTVWSFCPDPNNIRPNSRFHWRLESRARPANRFLPTLPGAPRGGLSHPFRSRASQGYHARSGRSGHGYRSIPGRKTASTLKSHRKLRYDIRLPRLVMVLQSRRCPIALLGPSQSPNPEAVPTPLWVIRPSTKTPVAVPRRGPLDWSPK